MKEKFAPWYYAMIILLPLMVSGIKILVQYANSLISNSNYRIVRLYSLTSTIPFLYYLSIIPLIIGMVLKFLGRKKYRISKFFILSSIIIEILSICNLLRFGYFPYGGLNKSGIIIATFIIISETILLLVNPKWHIDSSSKVVMNKENKEKRQEINNKIIKEFKEKEEKLINKYYYIGAGIIISIFALFSAYMIMPIKTSVDKSGEVDQLELLSKTVIYKTNNYYYPCGYINSNDYVDIIDTIKDGDGLVQAYKVRNGKNVSGYIKANNTKIVYGRNSEFYGKTQSNERNEKVFQVKVVTETLRIRLEPRANSKEIGTVSKDEIYTVIEEKDGGTTEGYELKWYKIKTTFGVTGYVADRYKGDIYLEKLYTAEQQRVVDKYNTAMSSIEGIWHWQNDLKYEMELKDGKISLKDEHGNLQKDVHTYKYDSELNLYNIDHGWNYLRFDGQTIKMCDKTGKETYLYAFKNYATRN